MDTPELVTQITTCRVCRAEQVGSCLFKSAGSNSKLENKIFFFSFDVSEFFSMVREVERLYSDNTGNVTSNVAIWRQYSLFPTGYKKFDGVK